MSDLDRKHQRSLWDEINDQLQSSNRVVLKDALQQHGIRAIQAAVKEFNSADYSVSYSPPSNELTITRMPQTS